MSETQPSADRPAGAAPAEKSEKEPGAAPARGLPAIVCTVPPETPVFEVAQVMNSEGVGDVLVAWDRKPIGLLTDRDLVVRVLAQGLNPKTLLVWEVMSKPLVLASGTQDIEAAVGLMARHGIRRLPIVDEAGRLESILTLDDILLLGLNRRPHLRAIIQGQLESKKAALKPLAAEEPGLSFRDIPPITQAFSAAVSVARNRAQDVCTVISEAPIKEAAQLMVSRDVGDVFVVVDRKPVGILTDRDLVVRVMAVGADPETTLAWEVMTQPLVTVTDDEGVEGAVALMARHGIRRLPIVDDAGHLISVLTLDDILLLGLNGNLDLSEILTRQLRPRAAPPPVATVEPPSPPPAPVLRSPLHEMRAAPPVAAAPLPQPLAQPTTVAPAGPPPAPPPPAATVEPPSPQPTSAISVPLFEKRSAPPVAAAPRPQSAAPPTRMAPPSAPSEALPPVKKPSPPLQPSSGPVKPATLSGEARGGAEPPGPLPKPGTDSFGGVRFSQPVTSVARTMIIRPLVLPPKTRLDFMREWVFRSRDWLLVVAWLILLGILGALVVHYSTESKWFKWPVDFYQPKDQERQEYLEQLEKDRSEANPPR